MAAAGGSWSKGKFTAAKGTQQTLSSFDPVTQQYFTQASLSVAYEASAKTDIETLLGRSITDADVARLSGAPNGSSIRVRSNVNGIFLRTTHPLYDTDSQRRLFTDANGKVVLDNQSLFVSDAAPAGFGTRLFVTQVQAAEALGVDRIKTNAIGNPSSANGYYTWPRLGYNAPLSDSQRSKAATALNVSASQLPDLHSLFGVDGGSTWWKQNGEGLDVEFNPRKGSTSRQVLDSYLEYKGYRI